jgi:hypothetical protein
LSTINFLLWHVEVIHKEYTLFAHRGTINTSSSPEKDKNDYTGLYILMKNKRLPV